MPTRSIRYAAMDTRYFCTRAFRPYKRCHWVQGNERHSGRICGTGRNHPGEGLNKLVPIALNILPRKPSVSVLITCFNYGAYVGKAIDSALQQTYAPAEIIVSDDGSQDNSCEVVESYINRGLGIQLLRNPHGGMAANLNSAYRNCSGDVICLLDADDTFLAGKIEAVVNAFRAHPQAGFAIHRASMVDNQGRPRGIYPLLSDSPFGRLHADYLRQLRYIDGLAAHNQSCASP